MWCRKTNWKSIESKQTNKKNPSRFEENALFICFGLKSEIEKIFFRGGSRYGRGFPVSPFWKNWGLRQVILQIGTSIPLKSIKCDFGGKILLFYLLLLFVCSDDSFADREMPETVMSIDQFLIISLTGMMKQYS